MVEESTPVQELPPKQRKAARKAARRKAIRELPQELRDVEWIMTHIHDVLNLEELIPGSEGYDAAVAIRDAEIERLASRKKNRQIINRYIEAKRTWENQKAFTKEWDDARRKVIAAGVKKPEVVGGLHDDGRRMFRFYDTLKEQAPWLEQAVKESHAKRNGNFTSTGVPPVERVQLVEPVVAGPDAAVTAG